MKNCKTTCPYCGVGCGISVDIDQGKVVALTGDIEHPANAGRLCVKGTSLDQTLGTEGRLLHPTLHGSSLPWRDATNVVADKIRQVRDQYGPNAIAFYLSGQLLTEDYYVANKLMKGFLGSSNVDTNSRLCMSSAVAGYKRALGADFVPCKYSDLDDCDLLVMIGSNAAWTHPVLYQRIVEAKRRDPRKRIVVIDPRRTASCEIADMHLGIKPGSDAFLFGGLLRHLGKSQAADNAFVGEYVDHAQAALTAVEDLDEQRVLAATGLTSLQLQQFYQWFTETQKTLSFYSQGINQSATGTDKCNAIINCHLITGRIGKPGTGPFSITGQPNAMGGREVGGLANQLAAHMDFVREDIDRVARFWHASDIACEPGLKAVDMFEAMAKGEIRFLWVMATNPAVSLPDTQLVRKALQTCEFVVVSDCVADTDTAKMADMLLPARGWGEKSGTVTNSERCISRQRQFVTAPGEAMPDWWIISEVAKQLGYGKHFSYDSPAQIFAEHAALSGFENNGTRDFDISALSQITEDEYARLEPTYWPAPSVSPNTQQEHKMPIYTVSGRANMIPVNAQLPSIAGDLASNFILNTGRLRDQWHTMTRTGRVPKLMKHRAFFSITVNPQDAQSADIKSGDVITLHNDLGAVTALVDLDEDVPAQQVFSPIHWNDNFSGNACISRLIPAITDPISGQPQSKFAVVSLQRLCISSWGLFVSRVKPAIPDCTYWSTVPIPDGYLTLIALADVDEERELKESLGSYQGAEAAHYEDTSAADYRTLRSLGQRVQTALFLNADRSKLPSIDWCSSLFDPALTLSRHNLLAGVNPDKVSSGRLVCTCWEIGELDIKSEIASGATSLAALGDTLKCGTQCGSCVPELKRMLHTQAAQTDSAPGLPRH